MADLPWGLLTNPQQSRLGDADDRRFLSVKRQFEISRSIDGEVIEADDVQIAREPPAIIRHGTCQDLSR